ncbi:protein-serine/threonine phosphatase, variant 2 [Balamuthia mandrillaris]
MSLNLISILPKEAFLLTSLSRLSLAGNIITEIPSEIGNLVGLERLYLGYNKLTTLPDSICNLTTLQVLAISGNRLKSIPTCVFQLPWLKHLYLSGNLLAELPPDIGKLVNLQVLDVTDNNLTSLPDELDMLHCLSELEASYNQLSACPQSLAGLGRLVEMDLSANPSLSTLPGDLIRLTSLTHLKISYCNVSYSAVPWNDIRQLSTQHSLSWFSTIGNPFNPPRPKAPSPTAGGNGVEREEGVPLDLHNLTEHSVTVSPDTPSSLSSTSSTSSGLPTISLSDGGEEEKEKEKGGENIDRVDGGFTPAPSVYVTWAEMRGNRGEMEDTILVHKNFRGNPNEYVFAVFDGHGGSKAAELAAIHLSGVLEQMLNKRDKRLQMAKLSKQRYNDEDDEDEINEWDDMDRVLLKTFAKLDELILQSGTESGCTANVAWLSLDEGALWVANAGDSRAVLCNGWGEASSDGSVGGNGGGMSGVAERISRDHTPFIASERDRIMSLGGFVSEKGRVQNDLAVSRSLGDAKCKPFVTCEPQVYRIPLYDSSSGGHMRRGARRGPRRIKRNRSRTRVNLVSGSSSSARGPRFLIMACDGLWDEVSDQDAVNIVLKTCSVKIGREGQATRSPTSRSPSPSPSPSPFLSPASSSSSCSSSSSSSCEGEKEMEDENERDGGSGVGVMYDIEGHVSPATALRDLAFLLGSSDNISVMVVELP